MELPCSICGSQIEKERLDIGLEVCYSCAKYIPKVRECRSRLDSLCKLSPFDSDSKKIDLSVLVEPKKTKARKSKVLGEVAVA